MKIWNPNSEDYSPFFGQEKCYPIYIEETGIFIWKSLKVLENGTLLCQIIDKRIQVGKDENGSIVKQLFSIDDFYPWLRVDTNRSKIQAVCVRSIRKACTNFLGFHILKD